MPSHELPLAACAAFLLRCVLTLTTAAQRVPPEYWEDRLLRLKAMGLNSIQTYGAPKPRAADPSHKRTRTTSTNGQILLPDASSSAGHKHSPLSK